MKSIIRDPDARLDYAVDFGAEWLQDGETITSYEVEVDPGLTLESSSEADGRVTAWISGGEAGRTYLARFRITTNRGRTDDRTLRLVTRQR